MRNLILALSLTFGLLGCQTINFNNGDDSSANFQTQDWHHIGVLRLVEFSDPVNPSAKCEGKSFKTVQTVRGPLQVIVGMVTYGLYNPEQVSVACK